MRKTDEANFFMKVLCKNPNQIVNPERIRPISGMIQELNDMQNKKKEKSTRKRVQSASVTRSKTALSHSPSLYKPGEMNRSSRNLRQKSSLENELNRSK